MASAIAIASTTFSTSAGAAPGDYAYAHAQFLQGSLAGQALDQLVALAGEEAESNGSAPDGPHVGNLDLTLLGVIPLEVPGGIQLPLDQTQVGTLGQYAHAAADGSSTAAVGAITQDGVIGTGIDPADQMGALTLSLDGALQSLGLPANVLADVASLDLMIDGVSARATQAAPSAPGSAYSIGDLHLVLQSPLVAQLVSLLEDQVLSQVGALGTELQNQANGLLADVLSELPDEIGSVDITITGLDTVETLLSNLTTIDGPGLHVNLVDGTIIVDLDELLELNGRNPNTVVLTPQTLQTILGNVVALLNSVVDSVNAALGEIGVEIDIEVADTPLNLDLSLGGLLGSTLGQLLDPLLPDELDALIAELSNTLGVPLNLALGASLENVLSLLQVAITPLLDQLAPVFDGVEQVLRLTVNVQEATPASLDTQAAGDRFTVRALRLEVLPGTLDLVHLDLANATVGPNSVAPPTSVAGPCVIAITGVNPPTGSTMGGNLVTITGSGFNSATGVTFGDTPALEFVVINDTTIEAVAPAHAPGQVTLTVTGVDGCAPGSIGYEFVTPEEPGQTPSTTLPATTTPDQPPSVATLPATGSDTAGTTAAAGGLVVVFGACLLLIARRRTAASAGG